MEENQKHQLAPVAQSILKTLIYFDIFHYPLTFREIRKSIVSLSLTDNQIRKQLEKLRSGGLVKEQSGFYFLEGDWKIPYRKDGNRRAGRYWKKARLISGFIAKFPFVRGIMISGSLSKGFMTKNSDIDYFIITEPGRLWVCRSLLILFKKVFLLNSYKWFCLNYFIDSQNLEIEDKNLFTATELVTLKVTFNSELYRQLLADNGWTGYYYPHDPERPNNEKSRNGKAGFKSLMEKLLSGRLGDRLDNFFMDKTVEHWKRKFKSTEPEKENLSLKSRKHISKQNNFDFQAYVLESYKDKLKEFEEKYQVQLTLNGELKYPENKDHE